MDRISFFLSFLFRILFFGTFLFNGNVDAQRHPGEGNGFHIQIYRNIIRNLLLKHKFISGKLMEDMASVTPLPWEYIINNWWVVQFNVHTKIIQFSYCFQSNFHFKLLIELLYKKRKKIDENQKRHIDIISTQLNSSFCSGLEFLTTWNGH